MESYYKKMQALIILLLLFVVFTIGYSLADFFKKQKNIKVKNTVLIQTEIDALKKDVEDLKSIHSIELQQIQQKQNINQFSGQNTSQPQPQPQEQYLTPVPSKKPSQIVIPTQNQQENAENIKKDPLYYYNHQ